MKGTNLMPIDKISGSINGKEGKYYARVVNGEQVWQRKPQKQSALQEQLRAEFGKKYGTARKKLILLAIAFATLALGACSSSNGTENDETRFSYTLSWENKNQKYQHFTDLGNYAVLMNDADLKNAEQDLALFGPSDVLKAGCTATIKRNQKGQVIVGRNMDIDVSQTPVFLTPVKGGKHQALVFTYSGTNCYPYAQLDQLDKDQEFLRKIPYQGTDAMNEKDLYIEGNMREMDSEHNFYCTGIHPGKTRASLLALPALAAANCATVDEVLAFLKDSYDWYTPGFTLGHDTCIWNICFLVGDATGNYGLIEFAHNKFYYTPYAPGQGNYYIHPELAQYAIYGSGYGRLATALKGLPQCETEQQMMDNMKNCWYMGEILHPGCYGYDDFATNVNERRALSPDELQKRADALMAPYQSAARAYAKGQEKALRDNGNVWTSSLNFGVNCATRHLLLRLWERDDIVLDIQWK